MKRKNIVLLLLLLIPLSTQAFCDGPIVPCGREGTPPCVFCHIFVLVDNVLRFILSCITPLMSILLIVAGGFLLIISGGVSTTFFNQAKSILTAVVVGLIIMFFAWVAINTFLSVVGIADWVGVENGGFRIVCGHCLPCEELDLDVTGKCIVAPDTVWGADFFDCLGDHYRCRSGICEWGCLQGSECESGEYCRASDHQCVSLSTCTDRYENSFGYFDQLLGEDRWNHCSTVGCGVGDCNGSRACRLYTDGQQHNCLADCNACDASGSCTGQTTLPGENKFNCIGVFKKCEAGSCINVECVQCSICNSDEYCETDYSCDVLPFCTKCNTLLGYDLQESNEDLRDECSAVGCNTGFCKGDEYKCGYYTSGQQNCGQCYACNASGVCSGMTTNWGDSLYSCVGINRKCQAGVCQERECSRGSDCPNGEYCDNSNQCVSLPTCGKRRENNLNYTTPDTGWGDNLYECVGDNVPQNNRRCYSGVCRTCGGRVYSDGCGGCSAPSGSPSTLGCWYNGTVYKCGVLNLEECADSCTTVCSGHGGCIAENWNDSAECSVCKNWNFAIIFGIKIPASCGTAAGSWLPEYYNHWWQNKCYIRSLTSTTYPDQVCDQVGDMYSRRQCVCRY